MRSSASTHDYRCSVTEHPHSVTPHGVAPIMDEKTSIPTDPSTRRRARDPTSTTAKRARHESASQSPITVVQTAKPIVDYLTEWCARFATCSHCTRSVPGEWFQCGGGGHALCKHCATTRDVCKICKADWDKDDPPANDPVEYTVNQLNEFKSMACYNSVHGCSHVGTRIISDHSLDCEYRVLPCVFDGGACSSFESSVGGILARNMPTHVENWHLCIEAESDSGDYKSYEFTANDFNLLDMDKLSQVVPLTIGGVDAYLCWHTLDKQQCSVSVVSIRPLTARVEISTETARGEWREWVHVPSTLFTGPRESVKLPYLRGLLRGSGKDRSAIRTLYGGWARVRIATPSVK